MTTDKEKTMETININGIEYIPAESTESWEHVCVIADRGWIFEGYADLEDSTILRDAHVVRKWSNGLGIGALADPEHKDDYTLDAIGTIRVAEHAVIATIPLRW